MQQQGWPGVAPHQQQFQRQPGAPLLVYPPVLLQVQHTCTSSNGRNRASNSQRKLNTLACQGEAHAQLPLQPATVHCATTANHHHLRAFSLPSFPVMDHLQTHPLQSAPVAPAVQPCVRARPSPPARKIVAALRPLTTAPPPLPDCSPASVPLTTTALRQRRENSRPVHTFIPTR